MYPQIVDVALASRAFQTRVVQYLAGEAWPAAVSRCGAGLPAAPNTHEIAQGIAPGSRVVYVDHDPFVVTYGRRYLASAPGGTADFVEADLHQPAGILGAAARILDFSQPIALLLMGVMGHLEDADAFPVVHQLVAGLPPGSYLALQDGAPRSADGSFTDAQQGYDDRSHSVSSAQAGADS